LKRSKCDNVKIAPRLLGVRGHNKTFEIREKATMEAGISEHGTSVTSDRDRAYRIRIVAYWIFTLLVAYEMVAGALWALLQLEYPRANLTHLGYPHYLLTILGAWDVLGAVALLVPRFGRLKEWAYAGAFFNYSGAVASHVFAGDGPSRFGFALAFAIFTLASWALRPIDRTSVPTSQARETSTLAWLAPIPILAGLLILALLTLPKMPPPP